MKALQVILTENPYNKYKKSILDAIQELSLHESF